MGYRSSPFQPAKNEFIVGVGWHVYVNGSLTPDQARRPAPMTNGGGHPVANELADGQEVEILSWKPRSHDGVLYQIRRLSDGSEWWVAAKHLRRDQIRKTDVSVAQSR